MNKPKDKQNYLKGNMALFTALVLILVGLGVAIKLTSIHYLTHTDPTYKSVCAISEDVNCATVAQSPFSQFLNIPVSVWGIFGYLLMGVLVIWGLLQKRRLHSTWPIGALFLMFTASMAASAVLAYISFEKIDSLCIFCTSLYAINLVLFVIGIVLLIQSGTGSPKAIFLDLKALFYRPLILACLVIVPLGMVITVFLFIPRYWQHPGWKELPDLATGEDDHGCHWIGATNPLVTVIEFSDYECPYCRRAHKEMRLRAARFPEAVRLVHQHMPLDNACNDDIKKSFHNRACEFSKAAECAAEQDMFWPMNDALFSVQEKIQTIDVDVISLAVRLGIDRSQFKECMAEEGIPDCIQNDLRKARLKQVEGTPTFFIGDQPYLGSIPEGIIESLVKKRMAEKKLK